MRIATRLLDFSDTRSPVSAARNVTASDESFPKSNDGTDSYGMCINLSRTIFAPSVVGQTVSMPSSRYSWPRGGS